MAVGSQQWLLWARQTHAVAKISHHHNANRAPDKMAQFLGYKLLFLYQLVGGSLSVSHETIEAGYFSADSLPSPLSTHRTTPGHISDAFEALHQPVSAVVVD